MNLIKIKKNLRFFTDLKFAIAILLVIAIVSSLGSFIEQDENIEYYQNNYPIDKPIYGFITWKVIISLGLDHIYSNWWFLILLIILAICLVSCTFSRQLPIFSSSKQYFFKKNEKSFLNLPFSVKLKNIYFLKENIINKLQVSDFYIYQYGNLVYGYRGLIGRISPILVHISLIIILGGSSWGAFNNFKAQEILPKGEIFHIQNPVKLGSTTILPSLNTRVNDFWVEYQSNRIKQFYSNISILDSGGNEIKTQTISVNNPLRYKGIDFYQSDWNLLGIRIQDKKQLGKIYEVPLFTLNEKSKSWITWIEGKDDQSKILIFDQLQNVFALYDKNGKFVKTYNLGDEFDGKTVLEIIPSTGLQIKYDPSISIIYIGFGLLMITAFLSYLPYTQIWIYNEGKNCWLGTLTNRGKINLEIEFENFIREFEKRLFLSPFRKKIRL
jgi:cytochrome c biogenesis protein